ncbi:MAG TPA: hypothetical protein PLN91_00780 [Rhodanobacteraceae bacterium]|nr:hypothetical protein [Rhodanobacteraceae bacterium]
MTIKRALVPVDVIDALWRGKTDLARSRAKEHQAELQKRAETLREQLRDVEEEMRALSEMALGGVREAIPTPPKRSKASPSNAMSPEARRQRAKAVIDLGLELAREQGGKPVTIVQLTEELARRKVDLGVGPEVARITVANILYRASQFRRQADGVYAPVQKSVDAKRAAAKTGRAKGAKR